MTETEYVIKRIFDVVASMFGLLLCSPIALIIYCLIKCEDGGPVIFKQERIGYRGKPFILLKFRTMAVTAEADGTPQLCHENDERLTKIGSFLRKHHMDELPQLWNVLKGDMSVVGPRPERKFFIDQIMEVNPEYELLYQIRPGLFSYATLYNGYTDTMEKMLKRLEMDLQYLRNQSLWLDFKIFVLTMIAIFTDKRF